MSIKKPPILIISLLLFIGCGSTQGTVQSPTNTPQIVVQAVDTIAPTASPTDTIEATVDPVVEPIEPTENPIPVADESGGDEGNNAIADDIDSAPDSADEVVRPDGWTEESHSKSADPNYDVVFPDDQVNTVTITVSPDVWQAMIDDMTALYGEAGGVGGRGGQAGGRPGGGRPEGGGGPPPGGGQAGGRPEGGPPGGGPGLEGAVDNPVWVSAESIQFDDLTWQNVGIRFKGNSSLRDAWQSGSIKLPFKLDFDRYEDDYPAIDNQRFYGFNQLTLSNNAKDNSFMRQVVASEIMQDAGVYAPHSSFYQVQLDHGEGVIDLGLYAMVEVVDDTVIETQFSDDDGNVYKPEGYGSSFAVGTFSEIDFDKETNQKDADYSDILALYDALHAETRTTDPVAWRSGIEAVLDVDSFLNWLAVNTLIQNWDTYGVAYHNYFLYNNPETDLLTWIAWDLNEALAGNRRAVPSLSQDEVSDQWPLIRYFLDDEIYAARYTDYVEAVSTSVFTPEQMDERYTTLSTMISPYITTEISETAFESAVSELITHTSSRQTAAQAFLAR